MAMDTITYAILKKKVTALASGIKSVSVGSDNKSLVFTCNDAASTTLTVSLPSPINDPALINKITLDTTTNELMYDGVKICKCNFTADQLALLKKFTVGADGSLFYNGSPLAMLTQQERDAITDITTNIKFNKDASGDIESVEIGGAVIKETTDPVTGDTAVKIGDVIVSGKETITTSSTTTDANGNPVNTTVTTTKTSSATEQTTVTNSVNPDNGNSINTVEVIKGGAEGINVGSVSGTKTTTETDGTGMVVDTKTEDVSYTNGVEDQWMTLSEVNDVIDGFSTLGWNM